MMRDVLTNAIDADTNPATRSKRRSYQCLIADDVRASHRVLARWLSEYGIESAAAIHGREAWERLQNSPADLLITDIEMPECSGLELLCRIRHSSNERLAKMPVLVMTSLHDGSIEATIHRFGGDGLMIKPLAKVDALRVILNALSGGGCGRVASAKTVMAETEADARVSPTLRRLIREAASIQY